MAIRICIIDLIAAGVKSFRQTETFSKLLGSVNLLRVSQENTEKRSKFSPESAFENRFHNFLTLSENLFVLNVYDVW